MQEGVGSDLNTSTQICWSQHGEGQDSLVDAVRWQAERKVRKKQVF